MIQACDVDPSDARPMAEIEKKTKRYPRDLTDEYRRSVSLEEQFELLPLIATSP